VFLRVETRRFGNWICFRPQVKGGEDTYSVGTLRKSRAERVGAGSAFMPRGRVNGAPAPHFPSHSFETGTVVYTEIRPTRSGAEDGGSMYLRNAVNTAYIHTTLRP
jgi:hypothetical protein